MKIKGKVSKKPVIKGSFKSINLFKLPYPGHEVGRLYVDPEPLEASTPP
jgi:hypothetical protein